MSALRSALYQVRIAHRRSRPKKHRLKYGAFYLLLDLDELDQLDRSLRWFSVNRFNLFSFFARDHGPGTDEPLRPWVEAHLQRAGCRTDGGRIRILCLPRIFGYTFNPLTVYFCENRDGSLAAILYEVSNTFGERHGYLFRAGTPRDGLYRHDCAKEFYVSPFLKVEGRYFFRIRMPADRLFLHIHQTDAEGPVLDAWVRGTSSALTDGQLLATLVRFPLLTLKVIGGIHWEALKLWLKGIGLTTRPPAPTHDVTFVDGPRS